MFHDVYVVWGLCFRVSAARNTWDPSQRFMKMLKDPNQRFLTVLRNQEATRFPEVCFKGIFLSDGRPPVA
ncbi:unnamed protein product [Ectocarpus sp. 12 AP-2014]